MEGEGKGWDGEGLPPASEFVLYERALPGSAERILVLLEAKRRADEEDRRAARYAGVVNAGILAVRVMFAVVVYVGMSNAAIEQAAAGRETFAASILASAGVFAAALVAGWPKPPAKP